MQIKIDNYDGDYGATYNPDTNEMLFTFEGKSFAGAEGGRCGFDDIAGATEHLIEYLSLMLEI